MSTEKTNNTNWEKLSPYYPQTEKNLRNIKSPYNPEEGKPL